MISLKVDNLTFKTSNKDLEILFGKYGDVGDVYIPKVTFLIILFITLLEFEDRMDNALSVT